MARPTVYRAEYARVAFNFCLLGATDAELARALDVNESTVNAWKLTHPKFSESLRKGKLAADSLVAERLYQRALGYSHEAVKIATDANTGKTSVVPYTEHYPPDTTAAIFWLKNRRPIDWRDRREVTGADGGAIVHEVRGTITWGDTKVPL